MRHVLVARVFAPRLLKREEPDLDGGAVVVQERSQDAPGLNWEHWMDATQHLSPGAAQQCVQHLLRLVIERMRSGNSVRAATGDQIAKKGITKVAGGLL